MKMKLVEYLPIAAVEGNVLSSETRWYQGSFNPTKKSVTKVKSVGRVENDHHLQMY